MGMVSIGTMAQLNGVTPRTLRFYASKGLLQPCYVDLGTGFRYYDLIKQSYELDHIQELQSLGCSLEQISEVISTSGTDESAYLRVLEEKEAEYEQQMRTLHEQMTLVRTLLAKRRLVEDPPPTDVPSIEQLPARRILQIDASDLDPACADQGYDHIRERWEYISRKIKADLREKGHPIAALLNAGCGIRRDNLVARDFVFDQFFVFEDEAAGGDEGDEGLPAGLDYATLPAGEYAVLYSAGSTYPDGTYKTADNICRLLDFIETQGYEVAGDYFDETLGEAAAPDGGRSVFFKMLVPIRRRTP